jgi:S-adenosylmethionine hydrolase
MVSAYEAVGPGQPLGIVGSSGYLEVSVRGGSAVQALGLALGDPITLRKP